jgi:3-oxoacyl-[acyl-carrier protein] reductase
MTNTDMITDMPEKTKIVTRLTTHIRQLTRHKHVVKTMSFLISDDSKHMSEDTIRDCGGQIMIYKFY